MAQGRMTAVIDIDGVLADVRHRLHHLHAAAKDWDAFFAAAADDPLLPEGHEVATCLAEVYDVVYLSGRPERYRADTLDWLKQHRLPAGELLLRPMGDRRPARQVKVEVLRRLAEQQPVVVLVDDDPQVLASARDAGFDVLPADWMAEDATLREAQEVEGET